MSSDNSLFLLIKSLSQAEKRYFKIFAGRHVIGEENRYVELFDAVDKQVKRRTYDEKKLIRFFKNKIAHFPSAKHYLFNLILKSLRAFHEGELIYQQVNDRITDIKLLMRRGLYKKSKKLLLSAKKMANEIDNSRLLLELLQLERRLARFITEKTPPGFFNEIQLTETRCIKQLGNEALYNNMYDRVYLLVQRELILRDPKTKKELIYFTREKLVRNSKQAISFTAKWNYFSIRSGQASLLDHPAESKENMKQLVELFEQNPIMQKEYAANYIYILSDYLTSCFYQSDFKEFPRVLSKMKNFRVESNEDEFLIFNTGEFLELVYLIITDRLEEALQLLPDITGKLQKFNDKLTKANELAFLSNISAIYFLLERWEDGLDWVNKIILHKAERVRFDIQSAMRILQLIMHYELKNYDLVDYLLRADLHYYRQHKRYFPFERICLQMITALLKSAGRQKNKKTLSEFQDKLLGFRKEHKEFITGYSEVFAWVTSRLNEKSIRIIYSDLQPAIVK